MRSVEMDDPSRPIVAAILAGGQSRRMGGREKCFLPLAGRPVIEHILDRLSNQVDQVVVSANGEAARFEPYGLTVVPDLLTGSGGPLVGILSIMEWVRLHLPAAADLVTVPGDSPFIPRSLVTSLWRARNEAGRPAAIALSHGRLNPLVGLWPLSVAERLRSILEEGVAKAEIWARKPGFATFVPLDDSGIDPLFNINTPEDLVEAERMLASAVPPA